MGPWQGLGLSGIPLLGKGKTRSISAENPTGEKGGGAKAAPEPMFDGTPNPARELGEGWKTRPFISLEPGSVNTLAEIEGPGVIQHIWITARPQAYRSCILRFYWDGEETPSIEVPLGDFFACGHGKRTIVNSMPISVNSVGGFNSYWPMPFRKSARITIESNHHEWIRTLFYQITYSLEDVPQDAGYFHAQWRRSMTTRDHPEHTILDGVKGVGHYAGTYFAWTKLSNGWWGEGEVKFYIDGDGKYPTICGTGAEDYVGGAWCFAETGETAQPYTGPFLGLPLVWERPEELPLYGMYRWHIPDPIRFESDLRVTVQALGWWPNHRFQPLTDDIATTAFWYQTEPHGAFPAMVSVDGRLPR
ncbi:MAG TPA: DUF2961 domain-containing protein [Candidatus Hydrogenedentes bacterium]|nr:DUF2961 domain-containing protein [Candidatus Hydrogenedentota bacterium]